MLKKYLTLFVLGLCSFSSAQNIMSNGNMEYGDGGWYLWNKPEGPAKVEFKIAEPKIGVDGSQGAVVVIKEPPHIWWGLQIQPPKFLTDSAYYTLSFKAKGDILVIAIVQGGPPDYRQKESSVIQLTKDWKTYTMTFLADQKGYGLNNVSFLIGHQKGTLWLDDVEVKLAEGAADTTWYLSAEARIDSIRKVDFSVPAKPGEKVSVELLRHEFPFGTALALYDTKDSVEKWYRSTAAKYFWHGVTENQFKWPEYEPKKGKLRKDELNEYFKFAKENGWDLRGHALVWAIQGYNYDKHFSNKGSCKEIAKNIKQRIDRDLKEYKGKFVDYDVWNEPFHERFLFDKCGWDLMDSAFVWAHRADPTAVLYINEYNVVSAGETDFYYDLIKRMLDKKIPVQGIGVQCHYQARPVSPGLFKERIDKLATFGLPIKVTEFDIGTFDQGLHVSEQKQAEEFEKFIRSAYSHPAISGILLWGFWDNRHWLKNGGIIASDGRAKPAAKTVYDLWHKTWTTRSTVVADSSGKANFRGFPGKYQVTIGKQKKTLDVKSQVKFRK